MYDVKCQMTNYQTKAIEGVEIKGDLTTTLNIILEREPETVTGKDNMVVGQNLIDPKAKQKAKIMINLSERTKVKVKIWNVAGDLVKEFPEEEREGNFVLSWDGQDDNEEYVSPGVYYVHIKTDLFEKVERIGVKRR